MTTIQDEDDYGAWQNPDEGYGGQDNPQTLYADAGGSKQGPGAQAGSGSRAQKAKTAAAIKVSVNPASKIKLEPFVALLAKTPGLAPELKGRIVLDKKSNAISVPDFSGDQPVPGKEWLVSLGKAGSDWEITTARLIFSLDLLTSFKFQEHLAGEDQRGVAMGRDPDESLVPPVNDLTDTKRGLILGLTFPNEAMLAKNPPTPGGPSPPQIARLKSGKGLILIARDIVVKKRGNVTKDAVLIPPKMIAMTFFHELSAHASFFQLGLDAEHSEPRDPLNNAVDRNAEQAESTYQALLSSELATLETKLRAFIDAMNKAVP